MALRNSEVRGPDFRPTARKARELVAPTVVDQALAGARGAQDALTLGLGDRVWAGGRAIADAANGKNLATAYRNRMAQEKARDRFDEQYFRTARTLGEVAGTGAQIVALGPAEGLIAGGARMAEAAPMIGRELAVLGAAGGTSGLAGQAASDLQNLRLGSAGDYAGAALGGAAGALTARSGWGGRSAAVDGAVTSIAQDAFNRRLSTASVDRAREAALVGGTLGAMGGYFGRKWSSSLSRREKGALGEDLSMLRSRARGQNIKQGEGARARQQVPGGYTIPDHISTDNAGNIIDIVEAKFGPSARLSKGQRKAYDGAIPNFRVDHFLPRDIGAAMGVISGDIGRKQRPSGQATTSTDLQSRRK
ncbi:MAG: hypothetical protein CGW95_02230 [Phenylobacterium zucineum]|nr:MAG: hypothetical protein CGW95_02230 [Phenylobacterium zucineum]